MAATNRRLGPLQVERRPPVDLTSTDADADITSVIAIDKGADRRDRARAGRSATRTWRRRIRRWLDPNSPALTYLGLGLTALGVAIIAYTWARVSGTLAVSLQLPYVASGGVTGLALVVIGSNLVSIASKRRDSAARERQLQELAELIRTMAAHREGGRRP